MAVPEPRQHEYAKVYAERLKGALSEANDRLTNDRLFWDEVFQKFGGGQ